MKGESNQKRRDKSSITSLKHETLHLQFNKVLLPTDCCYCCWCCCCDCWCLLLLLLLPAVVIVDACCCYCCCLLLLLLLPAVVNVAACCCYCCCLLLLLLLPSVDIVAAVFIDAANEIVDAVVVAAVVFIVAAVVFIVAAVVVIADAFCSCWFPGDSIFFKWAIHILYFVYFWSFSNKHHYNFCNKLMWKCPFSIWCWDSNPQPSKPEYPPITTRPGLPPTWDCIFLVKHWSPMHLGRRWLNWA